MGSNAGEEDEIFTDMEDGRGGSLEISRPKTSDAQIRSNLLIRPKTNMVKDPSIAFHEEISAELSSI